MAEDRMWKRGYVLVTVLWICVGIGGLAALISVTAQTSIDASRNRIAVQMASWAAAGCLARTMAALAESSMTTAHGDGSMGGPWSSHLQQVIGRLRRTEARSCAITARPVGARLDVNSADEQTLGRLLRIVGMRDADADSAAAALLDWRDADGDPRALGAERAWYVAHHLTPPTNRPFDSVQEVHHVRGLSGAFALDSLLDVEPGPIAIGHAAPQILLLLPGFTAEAVGQVRDMRERQEPILSIDALSATLSGDVRRALEGASSRLPSAAVFEPLAWIVTARSTAGTPGVTVAIEARLASGRGTIMTRYRSWIE